MDIREFLDYANTRRKEVGYPFPSGWALGLESEEYERKLQIEKSMTIPELLKSFENSGIGRSRKCQCGNGQPWETCPEGTQYCG